jgi:O-antigen/teichoic acid export membrane protein
VGLANVLTNLGGIFIIPIITKTLGAHDYGLYVQFTVTISLILSFATLGLPYSMVRFLSGSTNRKQIQEDLYSSIALISIFSIIISTIIMIFSRNLAEALFDNYSSFIILLAVLIPVEGVSSLMLNTFRIFQDIKKYTLYSLIKTYAEILVIAAIVLEGYKITAVALSILAIRVILLLIISLTVMSSVGLGVPHFKRIREYVAFGLPTVPANIASWVTNSCDRYIIGAILGLTYVGYYNPSYNLGAIIVMFMTPINFVLVSQAARFYEDKNMDQLKQLFKYSMKYYLLLAVPAAFGISILAKPILTLISTPEIAESGYLITPLTAASYLIMGFGGVGLGFACYLRKKTHIDMINWTVVALVNLGANLLLVPRWGIIGAAVATLIAVLVGFAFGCYFAFKYFDFDIDIRSMIMIIIASLIMSAAIINIYPTTLAEIVLTIVLGFAVYMAALVALKVIGSGEIKVLKSYIKKG